MTKEEETEAHNSINKVHCYKMVNFSKVNLGYEIKHRCVKMKYFGETKNDSGWPKRSYEMEAEV